MFPLSGVLFQSRFQVRESDLWPVSRIYGLMGVSPAWEN